MLCNEHRSGLRTYIGQSNTPMVARLIPSMASNIVDLKKTFQYSVVIILFIIYSGQNKSKTIQ